MLKLQLCLIFLCFLGIARAELITESVGAKDGRTCVASLQIPEKSPSKLPVLFLMYGNGVYTHQNSGLTPSLTPAFEKGEFAILRIDRPGLIAVEGPKLAADSPLNKGLLIIYEEKFFKPIYTAIYQDFLNHTQLDLVECAENAIKWIKKNDSLKKRINSQKIVLRGTSEGAEIGLRLYQKLKNRKNPVLDSLAGILLMSPPLAHRNEIFADRSSEFKKWVKDKKDLELIKKYVPFGSSYVEEFSEQPSLSDRILALEKGKKDTSIPLHIFHGTEDKICFLASVTRLKKNLKRVGGTNAIKFHQYSAGHFLNKKAGADSAKILLELMAD